MTLIANRFYIDEEEKVSCGSESVETDRFQELLTHLQTLPNANEKIACLIEEKTKDEQNKIGLLLNLENELSFSQKCKLEIKKLKVLRSLEVTKRLCTGSA